VGIIFISEHLRLLPAGCSGENWLMHADGYLDNYQAGVVVGV